MIDLKREQELMLLLSRLNPSPDTIGRARSILKDEAHPIDYDHLMKLAMKNEVLSLLYHNLRDTAISEVIREKMKNAYHYTLSHNILNATETSAVLSALKSRGIEAISLKGAIASELIFGNPGLYPAADIDILVRPGEDRRAAETLIQLGYGKAKGISDNDLLTSHYHFLYDKGLHHLELHWNLVKRYYSIPPDFWWEDRKVVTYEAEEITLLSPERYLLYTIFRLFDHCFRPLKFFVLISEIINRYQNEIDWENLLSLSKRFKMERLMMFTLNILKDILGTKIPEDIFKKRILCYEAVRRMIIAGLFEEVRRPHLRMFFYTQLLDTPIDFLRVIARRFFPDLSEIRLRYRVDKTSKKVYAYYALNPFLVLAKRRKD